MLTVGSIITPHPLPVFTRLDNKCWLPKTVWPFLSWRFNSTRRICWCSFHCEAHQMVSITPQNKEEHSLIQRKFQNSSSFVERYVEFSIGFSSVFVTYLKWQGKLSLILSVMLSWRSQASLINDKLRLNAFIRKTKARQACHGVAPQSGSNTNLWTNRNL